MLGNGDILTHEGGIVLITVFLLLCLSTYWLGIQEIKLKRWNLVQIRSH